MTPPVVPLIGARFGDDWWQRGVIYQIYPRSFADTDGDGVGDLAGIIDHLDHLGPEGLGVDAIWLSPIYCSPGRDLGYDVSDHERIDPLFGSEADFDRLVAACHHRGIRVVLDLVMNHTSQEHRWFEASRRGREGPFADHYLWRDPAGFDAAGAPLPPNNWVSFFGGSGWEWEPAREQFYYHTFLKEQPELQWRTPAVEAAQWKMVEGWLDRGVDGFRLDVFNVFLKHPDLPDDPTRPGPTPWTRQIHIHDRDQPDLPALIERFRALLDARPGRMSVGELFDETIETAAALARDRHLVFEWELVGVRWSADPVSAALVRRDETFGPGRWPTVVLSNHDQSRHASRLAATIGATDTDAIARVAAVLLLTARGTPFLYYGEEIGMRDVDIPPEESVDTPALWVGPEFQWWDRSYCRTPMPWTDGPNAGFTMGRPWLRLGPDTDARNVRTQAAEPGSILALYRRLIRLRAATPALQVGTFRLLDSADPDVVSFLRETAGQTILVALNLGREPTMWHVPPPPGGSGWRLLAGTSAAPPAIERLPGGHELELSSDEGLVFEAVR